MDEDSPSFERSTGLQGSDTGDPKVFDIGQIPAVDNVKAMKLPLWKSVFAHNVKSRVQTVMGRSDVK
jgi:hypothetical protein